MELRKSAPSKWADGGAGTCKAAVGRCSCASYRTLGRLSLRYVRRASFEGLLSYLSLMTV